MTKRPTPERLEQLRELLADAIRHGAVLNDRNPSWRVLEPVSHMDVLARAYRGDGELPMEAPIIEFRYSRQVDRARNLVIHRIFAEGAVVREDAEPLRRGL